jgi:hypothetical protein
VNTLFDSRPKETLATTGVATTASALLRILDATAPFTGEDTYPTLGRVRVEAGCGVLIATSTDRIVIAHARSKASGDLGPVYLRREDAQSLANRLRLFSAPTAPVTLTVNGDSLVVEGHLDRCAAEIDTGGVWPDLGTLVSTVATAETSTLAGPIGIGQKLLAKLANVVVASGARDPMRFSTSTPTAPVRVEVGDWFLAIVMPCGISKPGGGLVDSVPFGLPVAAEDGGSGRG